MISFSSFSTQPENDLLYGAENYSNIGISDIDIDGEDLEDLFQAGGSRLTYPGEVLTSSQTYMRCVFDILFYGTLS